MNESESNATRHLNPIVAEYLASLPSLNLYYRRFVAYNMAAGIRKRFEICLRGVTQPSARAIPIIAVNHLTDDDPAVVLAACLTIESMIPLLRCSVHVMGEHIFQPGFLGAYLVKEPRWLSYLLFNLNVGWSTRWIGGHPVVYARTRLLTAHLNDILAHHGNLSLNEFLEGDVHSYLPGADGNARIRSVLTFRYRDNLYRSYEFDIFKPPFAEKAWARHRERIQAFVRNFAAFADRGRVVFVAPQGIITRDGKPAGIRSGVFQIVNAMKRDAELIPINITYDPMIAGRTRAFITIGKTVPLERGGSKEAFNARIKRLIHGDAPVPMSQLAAEALRALALKSESTVGIAAFRDGLVRRAGELAESGFSVIPDPADAEAFNRRLDELLDYFRKSGFELSDDSIRFDSALILDEAIQKNGYARRWSYCFNEFQARLEHEHGDFG